MGKFRQRTASLNKVNILWCTSIKREGKGNIIIIQVLEILPLKEEQAEEMDWNLFYLTGGFK